MLKILQYTNKIWEHPSLENVAIIAAQHVMESILEVFKNLKKNGLDPQKTFILGKCYSTSLSVLEDFRTEGFHISEMSVAYDSHLSFDDCYKTQIQLFFEQTILKLDIKKVNKIIIMDDGGYLLNYISDHPISKIIPIIGIEQTSSGFNFLSEKKLPFPILNVARSKAKLTIETPFIVRSCLRRLYQHIPAEVVTTKTILILGMGVIGTHALAMISCAQSLNYDPKTMSINKLRELLPQADLILGCSGFKALTCEDYDYLKPGVKLASFSSSDREFDAVNFRKQLPRSINCRENAIHKNIELIQSGFPINFWGSRMNMPMEHIQVTLALLTAAIYQALNLDTNNKNFMSLDQESELLIMNECQKYLQEEFYERAVL